MEGCHHVIRISIVYEIERPFLVAKDYNTNLVQLLPRYYTIIVTCTSALFRVRFSTSTNVHLKKFWVHEIPCTKNYNFWRPGYCIMLNPLKYPFWEVPHVVEVVSLLPHGLLNTRPYLLHFRDQFQGAYQRKKRNTYNVKLWSKVMLKKLNG